MEEKGEFQEQIQEIVKYNFEEWHKDLVNLRVDFGDSKLRPICIQNVVSIALSPRDLEELNEGWKYFYQSGTAFNVEILASKMESLQSKISTILSQYASIDFFLRLSTRSPKDSSGAHSFAVRNAQQALQILAESDRVAKDVLWYIEHKFLHHSTLQLHFLPWRTYTKPNELRCFIYEQKLVAVTQYYLNEPFPFKAQEFVVVYLLEKLIAAIKQHIPYQNCVMDVEVTLKKNGIGKVFVIEFNPYGKDGTTGPVLFHWVNDAVILFNSNPTEVVFRSKVSGDGKGRVDEVKINKSIVGNESFSCSIATADTVQCPVVQNTPKVSLAKTDDDTTWLGFLP
jgi:hypothetical protein